MKAQVIDKQEIDSSKIISVNKAIGDIDPLPSTILYIHHQIERAVRLGNGEKSKVKILFQTTNGLRVVHTTVWAATSDFIVLKGGKTIPLDAIVDIVE